MAKKPAPKKVPAKKQPASAKKPTPAKKKPVPNKKAVASEKKTAPVKKPVAVKTKAPSKSKPVPPVKMPEPAPVLKPVFETPASKPAPPPQSPAAPKLVMKTGAGGAASLTVAAQASAGAAVNGSTHPAHILVLVSSGGWPVTDLTKDHFTLMEYFEVPGQQAPFSNNVTSFRNVGTGAYLLQVKPINGAPWRTGHHLAQILVSSADDRQGQGAVKLIIR